jgi:hypothetical protein
MKRAALIVLVLAAAAAGTARAQASADLLERGVRAVQNLEYDSAAVLLRAALARVGADPLPDSARARALMFLGATEFYRERRDSAVAAFTRLLAHDPRYRPDQLVFPPEVSSLYQEVRSGTRAVVPPVSELRGTGDRLAVRLYATSLHDIRVTVARSGLRAPQVRTLYTGPIGDSLEILWDGRDATIPAPDSGSFVLRVVSQGPAGRAVRAIEIPLDLRTIRADTLPWSGAIPDSLLRPEHTSAGGASRALAGGLLSAAAVVIMPSIISSGSKPTGGRFAVAAATGIAGFVGFSLRRHPLPIPGNMAANQAARLAWQRTIEQVKAENATRVGATRMVIRAGPVRVGAL